jgi:hypothetical protein
MGKGLRALAFGLVSFLFIVIVIGKYVIVAQEVVTGEWRADARPERKDQDDRGDIQLSFERTNSKWGHSQHGDSYSYSDLQGLTREQALNGGSVTFRLDREAGTVECTGTFTGGKGSGTFLFVPNNNFVEAMRSRGFDFSKSSRQNDEEDRLFSAALVNVTTAIADDVRSNFPKADVDDLFKAAIFKIDSRFMADMKATGFPDLDLQDLVKARIFKINAEYVRQVHEMGFDNKDFEDLVKFRIFKVTPEFLGQLRAEGFDRLEPEQVVKFRIFNIDTDFIRKAKAQDPNVTVEDLVRMKIGIHRGHVSNDGNDDDEDDD